MSSRLHRIRIAALCAGLIAALAPIAVPVAARAATCSAQAPGAYPNDPSFAPAENGQAGQTWDNEDWYLYDCIPQDVGPAPAGTGTASDPQGTAGMSVSALWNRTSGAHPYPDRGRNDVIVAYMEGGVNWRISQSCELKDRAWLNTGELPYPQNSQGLTKPQLIALGQQFTDSNPYDLNDDGVVNVEDYVHDPRIIAAEQGLPRSPGDPSQPFLHQLCAGVGPGFSNITPEDLIVAFGHCQLQNGAIVSAFPCDPTQHYDNDGNSYPNDINGWNFNRDNNDPQTEQSIYAHFDDESSQLAGEGNNGFGSIGMCPQCRYVPIKAGDEAIDRPDRVAESIVYAADIGVNVMDVTDASLGLNQTVQAAITYAWSKGMVVVWASNDFESADHTDGMYYAHVWPGNSLTGDHSTRVGTTCPPLVNSTNQYCPWVLSDTTFESRSSLTSYGPHALFSVPNNDGSTSTGTPTNAGVAALVVSELKNAANRGEIADLPQNADEVKQIVRAATTPISAPCPAAEPCFTGPAGASWNIQYGYGRPDVLAAATLIDSGQIPPTASLDSPDWYQEVDPTVQRTVSVSADIAARRAGNYTWELQYGLGPQPLDGAWTTFASGTGTAPQTVSASLKLSQIPSSFWNAAYAVDPQTRLSIEQYDVTVRVRVFANGDTSHAWTMGEDRRAFHLHHDPSLLTGTPLRLGSSGDASPTMADIEGRGWLDTIVPTSDGTVHAFRPNGTEAPGFPVHTGPAPGMSSSPGSNGGVNYLADPTWGKSVVPRPRDPIFSTAAVGDLTHTGAQDIVVSTASGYTYAWNGLGALLPGFPVLNGAPADFGLSVPPPDTPYSFQPENFTAGAPVLAHLLAHGDAAAGIAPTQELDIIQTAGDNAVHAWRPDGTPVPGWPVSTLLPPGTVPAGSQQTHDSKVVTTPAVVDINGDGTPDVVVGLDDSILGSGPAGAGVQGFLLAFDGRGTGAGGGGLLPGYPVKIPGAVQGYGVAQDFVTQGVESPAIYTDPVSGPQAVVNANLFAPVRVDLRTATVSGAFTPTTIPAAPVDSACPAPNSVLPPTFPGTCTLLQFTTSASLGKVVSPSLTPQAFQMGSSGTDVLLGITQTPGFGIRVDNGVGGWDPTTGASLPQYSHYVQGLSFFGAPAIADVTGDGVPDVIVPADSGALMAFDGVTGQPAAGFPKWTGGWSAFTPAVGDVAGSGHTDVAVDTREGYLFLWSTAANGCGGDAEAWHWHQNDWNDGAYGRDTRPPAAISDLSVSQQGSNDVLTFTAVGDNAKCGTAARYQVFTAPSPITQQTLATATPISVSQAPDPAGTVEHIAIPTASSRGYFAVRAVDAAGNIGPLPVRPSQGTSSTSAAAVGALSVAFITVFGLVGSSVGRSRRRNHGSTR